MTDNTYQPGDRIVLIWTSDEHTRLEPGTRGTVTFVDDLGTVHTHWDDGNQLGLSARLGDEFRHLTTAELAEEHRRNPIAAAPAPKRVAGADAGDR